MAPATKTRVAVGVATRHRHRHLEKALRSLSQQILPPGVEVVVVVVNNDPTDTETTRVCQAFSGSMSYLEEQEPGYVATRNRAVLQALDEHCRFIAFLDDDDTASCRWLYHLLSTMERNPWASICKGPVTSVRPRRAYREGQSLRPTQVSGLSGTLIELGVFHQVGLFDPGLGRSGCEDSDLFLRAELAGLRSVWSDGALISLGETPAEFRQIVWRVFRRAVVWGHLCQVRLTGRRRLIRCLWNLSNLPLGLLFLTAAGLKPELLFQSARRIGHALGVLQWLVQVLRGTPMSTKISPLPHEKASPYARPPK